MHDARPRLLIVDDEPMNRELLRRVLQSGYEVEEAEDVRQALEVLEGMPPHLILCDQLMPGQNGTDLAEIVSERWPGIPFLLLTGFDDDSEVLAAHASGIVKEIVSKPWRSAELKSHIARYLEPG